MNADWGISLPYPATWQVREDAGIVVFAEGGQRGLVLEVYDMTGEEMYPLDILAGERRVKVRQEEQPESISEVTPRMIGSEEGKGFMATFKDPETGDERQVYFAVVYHPSGERLYILHAITSLDLSEETQPIFEAIFEGVKFLSL